MNVNTQYVCYIRQKQASGNGCIGKEMKEKPPRDLKNHL